MELALDFWFATRVRLGRPGGSGAHTVQERARAFAGAARRVGELCKGRVAPGRHVPRSCGLSRLGYPQSPGWQGRARLLCPLELAVVLANYSAETLQADQSDRRLSVAEAFGWEPRLEGLRMPGYMWKDDGEAGDQRSRAPTRVRRGQLLRAPIAQLVNRFAPERSSFRSVRAHSETAIVRTVASVISSAHAKSSSVSADSDGSSEVIVMSDTLASQELRSRVRRLAPMLGIDWPIV